MKRIKERFLSRKGTKWAEIFLGVLITLALLLQPCLAVLTPNYIAMNQADKRLNNPGVSGFGNTLAYGDFLFVNDTTWSPGSTGETITSWKWNLSNLSDPSVFVLKSDRNASFGPFVKDSSSYLLNLTVTASDSSTYSPIDMVYQVRDHRSFVSANYIVVPAYDDRSPANPNGTVTFWDESYSFLDPTIYITEWWWKWTDLSTGVSKSISGQDHFTEDMTDTEFMVNLTVNNSQGNCVSITYITNIPPDNVYPIANFSVIPKNGVLPLEVGITDQALSMVNHTVSDVPLSYNYTVWNETDVNVFGTEFNTKNANVTLTDPGVYRIIQNVTNSFGKTSEFSVGDIIVSPPGGPIANFSASVREGLAPLNVTFIDQSTGVKPFTYNWVIGNETWESPPKTSDNPQFNLTYSDKYWVNLTITDKNGFSDYCNRTDFITVGPQKYPIVAFTAIPVQGPYPLNVSFIDQSVLDPALLATGDLVNPPDYEWDFDDGTKSDLKNPTHVFYRPKDYNVTLFVTQVGNGRKQWNKFINVTVDSDYPDITLNASFTAVPEYGNPPLTVSFVDTSRKNEPVTYEWDFDDGSVHETASNVTHVFGTPRLVPYIDQRYNVTLNVTGTMSGRTSEYSQWIDVQELDANFTNNSVGGNIVEFTDTSAGYPTQWYWLFGDGHTSRVPEPEHEYVSPGTYKVTLHAWNEMRKDFKTEEIVVPQ